LRKLIRGGAIGPEFYRKFDKLFAGNAKNVPVATGNDKSSSGKEANAVKGEERLYSMTEAINELNLNLTVLGIFDHSRELLSCPACGLFEELSAKGRLITAESDYPGIDTGLRFVKTEESEWECPDCGHLCSENNSD
jgi:hypothetical protein